MYLKRGYFLDESKARDDSEKLTNVQREVIKECLIYAYRKCVEYNYRWLGEDAFWKDGLHTDELKIILEEFGVDVEGIDAEYEPKWEDEIK